MRVYLSGQFAGWALPSEPPAGLITQENNLPIKQQFYMLQLTLRPLLCCVHRS